MTGVIILGMHRSGTSALTQMVSKLGLSGTQPADRLGPSPANPYGYFESSALIEYNERILRRLGGSAWVPPRLEPGWEHIEPFPSVRAEARELFTELHPETPWVWKDPRLCLTLPFWRTVLGPAITVVHIFRDPVEVAMSLRRRDGSGLRYGLALWEIYARAALRNINGLDVLTVRYETALADATSTAQTVCGFLRRSGIQCTGDQTYAAETFEQDLRRERARPDGLTLSTPQSRLFGILDDLVGAMRSFSTPPLPQPTPRLQIPIRARQLRLALRRLRRTIRRTIGTSDP